MATMAAFFKLSIFDNCHKPLSDKELKIISKRNKMAMWPLTSIQLFDLVGYLN
jgi:hypothetical protein